MPDLYPENIEAVVYLDREKPGVLDGIWVHFTDGSRKLYEGARLFQARSIVSERFPMTPGSSMLSDQPVSLGVFGQCAAHAQDGSPDGLPKATVSSPEILNLEEDDEDDDDERNINIRWGEANGYSE